MTGLSDEFVLAAFGAGVVALIAWHHWSKGNAPAQEGQSQASTGAVAPGNADRSGGGGDGPGGGNCGDGDGGGAGEGGSC
jgi:hypothetical protein